MPPTQGESHGSTSLDFEILKEPWNIYQISDGSRLRIRNILKSVRRAMIGSVPNYSLSADCVINVICAPELKGSPPMRVVDAEQAQRSVERADIDFETAFQENNDYLLNDGTRIKLYFSLLEVSRSSLCDSHGDRIYVINHTTGVNIKLAPQYRPEA